MLTYPGDTATPESVAAYFRDVAEQEYQLPGILPVMTSCVELTNAWVAPGDVKQVRGYLNPVDHWSVGYFQQQYDGNPDGIIFGWGTYSQLIDAEYALHRFCQEAVKFKDYEWHENTTDPEVLGRWCQAIQRSAVPDAYRTKGYPMAVQLLSKAPKEDKYPQRVLVVSEGNWVYDEKTNEWAKVRFETGDKKDLAEGDVIKYQPSDGGLWVQRAGQEEEAATGFQWPEAWDEPIWDSPNYQDRHPTRYTWRSDVEAWARYLVQYYEDQVWCNTYVDHPEGHGRTLDSIDVWGPAGRNDYLDPDVGKEIWNLLFYYEGAPHIDWIIYNAWMWTVRGGWQRFGTDDFSWHYDHIHVTYL